MIQAVSSQTGELVSSSSSFTSHDSQVNCVYHSSFSSNTTVWSGYQDGIVIEWTYPVSLLKLFTIPSPLMLFLYAQMTSESIKRTIKVGSPVFDIYPYSKEEMYFVLGSQSASNPDFTKEYKLVLYSIARNKVINYSHIIYIHTLSQSYYRQVIRNICEVTDATQSLAFLSLSSSTSMNANKLHTQDVILGANKSKVMVWSATGHTILASKSCSGVSGSITCLVASDKSGTSLLYSTYVK